MRKELKDTLEALLHDYEYNYIDEYEVMEELAELVLETLPDEISTENRLKMIEIWEI